MHILRRFGGLIAIAILIGLSVLTLVSLGEGFRIFVNRNDEIRLPRRDGGKYTFNMPWEPPTAVPAPTPKSKVKAVSSTRESLADAIKNVAAAILENVNSVASTGTSEATTLTSTLVVVPVALAATASALSGGTNDASTRGQQIKVDTSILGDLINAANSIVGSMLATGTDISNIGGLGSSSTASALPALIGYGNLPTQTTIVQASQESPLGIPASVVAGMSSALSVPVSTLGQSSLHPNTISALPSSLTTSSLPINLPPQGVPAMLPKQGAVSISPILTSSVLTSSTSFPSAMPSPSSMIGFFNNSKSSSIVAQILTPSPVSVFSSASFRLNSSTASVKLCPEVTMISPTCPAPVTETCTVTETWHSTHYEQTATLFSFMSIITVTCTETVSVCPQSAVYPPAPITAPLHLPSSGKSASSTAAEVLDLVVEVFSTSLSDSSIMPNLALDLPTLPTGSRAPTIGAERAFPAAPNPSLITIIPMSPSTALSSFGSSAQSGVALIISNTPSAAGQTTSTVTTIFGAAASVTGSLLSGAGVMPSALPTVTGMPGGLLDDPALANAAFVSGSAEAFAKSVASIVPAPAPATTLRELAGFQARNQETEGKLAVGGGLKNSRSANQVESKEAWHEATFCEGLPDHESCG